VCSSTPPEAQQAKQTPPPSSSPSSSSPLQQQQQQQQNDDDDEQNATEEPESIWHVDRATLRAVAIMSVSQFIITAGFGVIVPVLPSFANELG
jgi:hypothetical protein